MALATTTILARLMPFGAPSTQSARGRIWRVRRAIAEWPLLAYSCRSVERARNVGRRAAGTSATRPPLATVAPVLGSAPSPQDASGEPCPRLLVWASSLQPSSCRPHSSKRRCRPRRKTRPPAPRSPASSWSPRRNERSALRADGHPDRRGRCDRRPRNRRQPAGRRATPREPSRRSRGKERRRRGQRARFCRRASPAGSRLRRPQR